MDLLSYDRDLTKDEVAGLKEALQDYIHYVEYLLETYNLYSPEGTFTFPNGDTFYRVGAIGQANKGYD